MKRTYYLICAALLVAVRLSAQNDTYWERFSGPSGGTFNTVFQTNSGLLYGYPNQEYGWDATTPACLYRSADQGASWTKLTLTLNGELLHSFVQVGPSGSFYALKYHASDDISDNALYRSVDEGATWELLADHKEIWEFYETPEGALLTTIHIPLTISRSADNGQSWQTFAISSPYVYPKMEILPNGDLAMNETSYRFSILSKDDGRTWTAIAPQPLQGLPAVFLITASGALLRDNGKAFQRSADNGQTWQNILPLGDSTFHFQSLVSCASGRILGFANRQDLYYSDDDGLTWAPQPSSHFVTRFASPVEQNGYLFGYVNQALYRSTDQGHSWEFAAHGADLASVYRTAFISKDTFFALTENGLWRTDNKGGQWIKITDNRQPYYLYGNANTSKNCFSLNSRQDLCIWANDSLWRSDDRGAHLTFIPLPYYKGNTSFIGSADSVFFAGTSQKTYRSADRGQSWQEISGIRQFYQLAAHPSGRVFASVKLSNGQPDFRYSDDLGSTWLPVNGTWSGLNGYELFSSQSGVIYYHTLGAVGERMYRSTDNGATWSWRPFNSLAALSENALGHLFVSSGQYQISLDQGITWNTVPPPAVDYTNQIVGAISPDQYWYASSYNWNGLYRTRNPTTQGAYLGGSVLIDADADCSTPDAQTPLQNWTVEADGANTFFATTDSSGHYRMFVDTGAYAVQAQVPNALWWNSCEGIQNIQLDSLLSADTVDFSVVAISECPLMTVDLAIPLLRRCFDNTLTVNYCNQGAEQADSAWVDLILDPFASFVSATLPAENQGNDVYRFQVGNVATGNCGAFNVVVHIDCDSTVLGQTHCFTAHGYPDTLCTSTPNWSGATIQASISCQDSVVDMTLKNIGTAPSQGLDYIIIIDDVVLLEGNQSYAPNQEITITEPADGHTWRIESQQEPGHPFATSNHIALAFAEGCGGYNSLGYVNQFPVDEFAPSYDRECVENTGSYDPNDKQGFPLGTGAEHLIRTGQDLEYLIRFQNTGTDTAFTVVVRDTLSPWLDPASVRPGAASHPYTWSLSGQGVLSFTFSPILLPDSTANEAASHGFISFRIGQQPDVPLGTVIYNEADIYFDFNDPVVTNQTWHTIGKAPSVGLTTAPKQPLPSEILTTPQPAGDFAVFRRADGQPFRHDRLFLTDALGRTVRQAVLNGGESRLDRAGLDAGLYFFRIESADGHPAGAGRLQFL